MRRTDEEIGWEEARKWGVTSDHEYEAFKGTMAYQMAMVRGRFHDLWVTILEALRITL